MRFLKRLLDFNSSRERLLEENRAFAASIPEGAGAGTLVRIEMRAKARPDGYTFLAGGSSALAINPHRYTKSIGYDTLRI